MNENPPGDAERGSPDSPSDAAVTKPRKRGVAPVLVLASVVALAVAALTLSGLAPTSHKSGADKGETSSSERMHPGAEGEEEEGGPTAPAEYLTQKFTSGHDVTPAQIKRAVEQAKAIKPGDGTWGQVGPTNVGGRVTDLVVDPNHANTFYVAVSGGGIWKSTDAGDTFKPVWPGDQTQTMGALALGSDGTLWAGTGE